MSIDLRPATKADFDAIMDEPLPYRVRAFAAWRDTDLLGIGGLAFLPDGTVAAFMQTVQGARRYKVAMHKAALATLAEAKRLGIRSVVALADPQIEPAKPWLARLGFRPLDIDGNEVWTWQTR